MRLRNLYCIMIYRRSKKNLDFILWYIALALHARTHSRIGSKCSVLPDALTGVRR